MISVPIQIEHAGAIPVRAQISGAYAQAIRDGRLTPGAALPSVRGLSARLGVSPATIVAAYRELGTLGLVTASPRSAFRVAGGHPAPTQPRKEFQLNRIEPDLRIHPVAEFARLLAETAAADCSIGGYEDYRGHLALREAIAGLDREIGVAAEPGAGMLILALIRACCERDGMRLCCLIAWSASKGAVAASWSVLVGRKSRALVFSAFYSAILRSVLRAVCRQQSSLPWSGAPVPRVG